MDKKTRCHHSPEDKVRILRLHLLEQRPVSTLCDEEGIHPTLVYHPNGEYAADLNRYCRPLVR